MNIGNKHSQLFEGYQFRECIPEDCTEVFFNCDEPYKEGIVVGVRSDESSLYGRYEETKLIISSDEEIFADPDCSDMFRDCINLRNVYCDNFNTSKVLNMDTMFTKATALEYVDLKDWDVSNVKRFIAMFSMAENLKSVSVSNWDTSAAQFMSSMFNSCKSLEVIDVSNWDVSNVRGFQRMFYHCKKLEQLNVSKWDISNCYSFEHMFKGCENLISNEENFKYISNNPNPYGGKII